MSPKQDKITGIVVLVLGLMVFWYARQFPELEEGHPGPGLFPGLIGLLLAISGIILLFWSTSEEVNRSLSGNWISVFLLLLLMIIFPYVRNAAGFFPAIASVIFLVGLLMRLSLLRALVAAGGATGFIFLIFNKLLHVPL